MEKRIRIDGIIYSGLLVIGAFFLGMAVLSWWQANHLDNSVQRSLYYSTTGEYNIDRFVITMMFLTFLGVISLGCAAGYLLLALLPRIRSRSGSVTNFDELEGNYIYSTFLPESNIALLMQGEEKKIASIPNEFLPIFRSFPAGTEIIVHQGKVFVEHGRSSLSP